MANMSTFDAVRIAEGWDGEHSEIETIEAWQHLIDTGACWSLQGWFGRTAKALIDANVCMPARSNGEHSPFRPTRFAPAS